MANVKKIKGFHEGIVLLVCVAAIFVQASRVYFQTQIIAISLLTGYDIHYQNGDLTSYLSVIKWLIGCTKSANRQEGSPWAIKSLEAFTYLKYKYLVEAVLKFGGLYKKMYSSVLKIFAVKH